MAEEATATAAAQMSAPLLASEALGFSPQLLMDDIIGASNSAVQDGVIGMEQYLDQWRTDRSAKVGEGWDGSQEIEQGLVAFQTLLEFHTDQAFDFFEAWALRNIFSLKPGLPVVLPHQQGLDLTAADPAREQELLAEIETLRTKLDDQRQYRRLLQKANIAARSQRLRAERRLESLSFLDTPQLETLHNLPRQITSLQTSLSNLPDLGASTGNALAQLRLTEPGKRLWDTNKTGYFNWALQQLLAREQSSSDIGVIQERMSVGETDALRQAAAVIPSSQSPESNS